LHKKANDHYADNAGKPDKREGEIEAVTHGRDAFISVPVAHKPALLSGVRIAAAGEGACAYDYADLTDREAATAWGRGRPCAKIA
jgi:hypothetical protein